MAFVDIIVDVPLEVIELEGAGKRVLDLWSDHADELGHTLSERVKARTPVRTGALQEGVMAVGGVDRNHPIRKLLEVFFDPSTQLDAWGRQYDIYQEGPPLGHSTYTNDPRHMLAQADPEDMPTIATWAQETATVSLEALLIP